MLNRYCLQLSLLMVAWALIGCKHKSKAPRHSADEDTSAGEVSSITGDDKKGTVITKEIDGVTVVLDRLISGDPNILNGIEKLSPEPGDGSEFLSACQNPTAENSPLIDALKDMVMETDCARVHDKVIYMREFWVVKDLDISDISLLSKLTNVKLLHISSNHLQDISPLAHLVNLEILHLDENKISDLSPLSGLQKLHSLNVNGNAVVDLSPLATIRSLVTLNLDFNRIVQLKPLANLTALETLLLSGNQIPDISDLASLSNLRQLHLSSNPVGDLAPLSALQNLKRLDIVSSSVQSLAPIAGLSFLTELDARGTPVASAKSVATCPVDAASPAVQSFCSAP